jgi:hypothetical protein
MEAASFLLIVGIHTTWYHFPEDHNLNIHCQGTGYFTIVSTVGYNILSWLWKMSALDSKMKY